MVNLQQGQGLTDAILRLINATHHNPFEVLGKQKIAPNSHSLASNDVVIRTFFTGAYEANLQLKEKTAPMQRVEGTDIFEWYGTASDIDSIYTVEWRDKFGRRHCEYDPYAFSAPQLSDFDLHVFGEGQNWNIHEKLGAHVHQVDGVEGVLFATWAPGAARVSVVGDFNNWDGRQHPMRVRGNSGVWELFIPGMADGSLYKFEISNC